MGRTVPTFTMVLQQEVDSWGKFRRALRKEDQEAMDELFRSAQLQLAGSAYAARPIPFESIAMAMLVAMQRRVRELERSAEAPEQECDTTRDREIGGGGTVPPSPSPPIPDRCSMTGWLFDIYASSQGVTVWLIDAEGRKYRCTYPFVPSLYLHVDRDGAARAEHLVERFPFPISFHPDHRRELYSDDVWDVWRVDVHDPLRFKQVVQTLERTSRICLL